MRFTVLRYARTRDHEGIRISITNIPTTTSTSPSSGSSSSSRRYRLPYQKWQAHKHVVLLLGSTIAMTQVSSKNTFSELRLVAAHFISRWGVIYRFSNVFILGVVSFCDGWDRHVPTRSWIKSHNNIFFTASGFHPTTNPPLLSAEARDATGPSLSGGPSPSPGHRVSGLGGPELVRPIFHAALTSTCWNEICIILSQLGAAHEVMVDETKPNSNCWNQWIDRSWPVSQCFTVSRHGSSLFFRNMP